MKAHIHLFDTCGREIVAVPVEIEHRDGGYWLPAKAVRVLRVAPQYMIEDL